MNRFLRRANAKLTVGNAAWLLSGSAFMSMFLGLWRERLLAGNVGLNNPLYSAYLTAFRVPDFMFAILTSGALSVTFIPILSERLSKGNRKSAWELSSSLMNFMALLALIASIIMIIFAGPLSKLLAPGFDSELQAHVATMMRLMSVNPFLFAISSVMASMQQAVRRFFFVALAPSVYNLCIILGVIYLYPRFGIEGVAFGVIIGAIVQLITAASGLQGLGFVYFPRIFWKNHGFREVLRILPARSFDQSIDYVNNIVENNIASGISKTAVGLYQVAFNLHAVPINLIGVAISTAAFPQMTERINQGRPDLFKKELLAVLRIIIWLAMPVSAIAYFGRGYLVRLVTGQGNKVVASLVGLLVVSIFFRSIFHIMSRVYYAHHDTKTPLKISVFSILLNITLAITLARPGAYGIQGLAIAQSLTALVEVMILITVLTKRYPGFFTMSFLTGILRMISATGIMSFVLYTLIRVLPLRVSDKGLFSLMPKFSIIVGCSMIVYVIVSALFKLREADPIIKRVKRAIFFQAKPDSPIT